MAFQNPGEFRGESVQLAAVHQRNGGRTHIAALGIIELEIIPAHLLQLSLFAVHQIVDH